VSQRELLKKTVEALERLGIEYMITSSIVSSIQGAPRSTHDIDIVVYLKESQVQPVLSTFPAPDYYVSEAAVAEAMTFDRMFNVLEISSGQKVDFWIYENEPFNQSRFARRRLTDYQGIKVRVSSPEDTILSKLVWDQMAGRTEKQFKDALHVYEVQMKNLDSSYLQDWANRLDIITSLERLKREAMPEE
jgi:hypothetical protein